MECPMWMMWIWGVVAFLLIVRLWRLRRAQTDEKRERQALILVGISFFLLPLYVAVEHFSEDSLRLRGTRFLFFRGQDCST